MLTEQKRSCIRSYAEGLILYRMKKFRDALEKFREALDHDPADGPSKIFISRCEYYIEHPVPDSWDGVFEMKTK